MNLKSHLILLLLALTTSCTWSQNQRIEDDSEAPFNDGGEFEDCSEQYHDTAWNPLESVATDLVIAAKKSLQSEYGVSLKKIAQKSMQEEADPKKSCCIILISFSRDNPPQGDRQTRSITVYDAYFSSGSTSPTCLSMATYPIYQK
jgi:hypothetical protein